MKYLFYLLVIAYIFTSCSKDNIDYRKLYIVNSSSLKSINVKATDDIYSDKINVENNSELESFTYTNSDYLSLSFFNCNKLSSIKASADTFAFNYEKISNLNEELLLFLQIFI